MNMLTVCLITAAICARRSVASTTKLSLQPLSIPPSEYWDGDDGWWSTFQVQVGTPGQTVRLLPGTSASASDTIWVVLAEGCTEADPELSDCANKRGYTFHRNSSSTWSTQRLSNDGLFQSNTIEEEYLGLVGNAYYGFETVNLGLPGSGLPTSENQVIAGLATNNYWSGSLGLSPIPFNFTTSDNPIPSLSSNLRNGSLIRSLAWGYTAGGHYQDPPVFGSLTLGGYDRARFDPNATLRDVAFGADFSRDLVVKLQTITYDTFGSAPLLISEVNIFIDSLVTQLWLPTEVCQRFEQAFNLTWNSTAQLYSIDDDIHSALMAQNPTFTFTLAGGSSGNSTVDIVSPYAAFDLNVTQPSVDSTSRYFPLKRAQNYTQYTLGRVFLQEAYVLADYDRQNFSVSQASFPSTSVPQQLVAILPPEDEQDSQKSSKVSGGAIAGIVIGAVVILSIGCLALIWNHRKKKQKKQQERSPAREPDSEKDGSAQHETTPFRPELDTQENERYEMDQSNAVTPELPGDGDTLDPFARKDQTYNRSHEMWAGDVAAVELEAPSQIYERPTGR